MAPCSKENHGLNPLRFVAIPDLIGRTSTGWGVSFYLRKIGDLEQAMLGNNHNIFPVVISSF